MKIDKCGKLVYNLYDSKNYVIHITAVKQALDYNLKLQNVHKIINFNQEVWLKSYI